MKLFGNNLKLVILDVDGTILDLFKYFEQNMQEAVVAFGLSIEPFRKYLEDFKTGSVSLHASFADAAKCFWPKLSSAEIVAFEKHFRGAELLRPYPPIPGSIETIEWLKVNNISIALCTANTEMGLSSRLELAGIDMHLFDAVSTSENGYPAKPDPRALDPIFKKISVRRNEAAYVGDTDADLRTASGGHVRFLAVQTGGLSVKAFRKMGVAKNHILKQLSDIQNIIAS